jgi:formylglycine-generating enzyme required for sulfatase activity
MILIPAGPFEMGSDTGAPDEFPIHTVTLEDYYFDKYEVTNAQYKTCVDAGVCNIPQETSSPTREQYFGNPEYDNFPVIFVTWFDAVDYCTWRDAKLPTEAEWERAGRGPDNWIYPWGDETEIGCDYTNYNNCVGDTVSIGSYNFDVSPFGIYDMAGNAREWVEDYLRPYPGGDPNGSPEYGKGHRVERGGGFDSNDDQIRLPNRASWHAHVGTLRKGIRCARTP